MKNHRMRRDRKSDDLSRKLVEHYAVLIENLSLYGNLSREEIADRLESKWATGYRVPLCEARKAIYRAIDSLGKGFN